MFGMVTSQLFNALVCSSIIVCIIIKISWFYHLFYFSSSLSLFISPWLYYMSILIDFHSMTLIWFAGEQYVLECNFNK